MDSFPRIAGQVSSTFPQLVCKTVLSSSSSDVHTLLMTSAEVKLQTAADCSEAVMQAAEMIAATLGGGGKLLFCGNGGSAGDSQHLAAEFVATLDHRRSRQGLAALALTTNTSFLTAYANNYGFEGVFARQVETLGCPGDVLLAVPSKLTMHIQESHIALGHVMTLAVERLMDL